MTTVGSSVDAGTGTVVPVLTVGLGAETELPEVVGAGFSSVAPVCSVSAGACVSLLPASKKPKSTRTTITRTAIIVFLFILKMLTENYICIIQHKINHPAPFWLFFL